jgi:hypothetical protein
MLLVVAACLGLHSPQAIAAITPVDIPAACYNLSLDEWPADVDDPGGFSRLTTEQKTLDGIAHRFVTGRAIHVPSGLPQPHTIEIGQQADNVHFIHTYRPGPALAQWRDRAAVHKRNAQLPLQRPILFSYVVTYEGGSRISIPVKWMEGVFDSIWVEGVPHLPWADAVWTHKLSASSQDMLVVYSMQWRNPRPDREIASIVVSDGDSADGDLGSAAIFAITLQTEDSPGFLYFVSPEGSDANPGTFDLPWRTVARAAATLKGGDTAYVRGGIYRVTESINIANSGREGAWLTLCGYPGERPIIDAMELKLAGDRDYADGVINVEGKHYVRIKNLTVMNSRKSGIKAARSTHVDLLFNTVLNTFGSGIGVWGGRMPDRTRIWSREIRVIGNRLIKNGSFDMYIDDQEEPIIPIQKYGHECLDCSADGYEVAYNEISHGYKEAIDCKGPCRNGRIHHNYIYYHGSLGIYIDAWGASDEYMHDIDVYRNHIHHASNGMQHSSEGGSPSRDIMFHHNIVHDNATGGINIGGNGRNGRRHNIHVFNNTIYRNGKVKENRWYIGGGLSIGTTNASDVFFRNNIVAGNRAFQIRGEEKLRSVATLTIEYNLVNKGETADPDSGIEEFPHQIVGDPGFLAPQQGDLRLSLNSPAIDAAHPGEQFRDPDGSRGDIGALPYGFGSHLQGYTLSGKVVAAVNGYLPFPEDYLRIRARETAITRRIRSEYSHLTRREQDQLIRPLIQEMREEEKRRILEQRRHRSSR